jgi:hypothetical protein
MKTKVIKLQQIAIEKSADRISIDEMKSIWNDEENQYTEKQLLGMRDFACLLYEIIVQAAKRKMGTKVIPLNSEQDEKESNIIHPGEYGRAS